MELLRRAVLLVGMVGLAALAISCRQFPRPAPHSVLLFTFDAARADHFGAYGYRRQTTPATDSLARQGIVFRNYFAVAPYTLASFASLFTSKYPVFSNVMAPGDAIDPRDITLAQLFQSHGYRTAAFVRNPFLSRAGGYDKGFDVYVNYADNSKSENASPAGILKMLSDARAFLESCRGKRFFLVVHVLRPHNPYQPPTPFVARFEHPGLPTRYDGSTLELVWLDQGKMRPAPTPADHQRVLDLYDANLAYGDSILGRLLRELKEAGRFDSTDIVVTSDHGEAFGEHGRYLHNSTLYDEMIHIPLVIRPAAGRRLRSDPGQLADNVDLLPTLAGLEGISLAPGHFQGQSLLNPAHASRKQFVLSFTGGQTLLRSLDFAYIQGGDVAAQYYALRNDPREQDDLARKDPDHYSLAKDLENYENKLALLAPASARKLVPLGDRTAAKLMALGYLTPSPTPVPSSPAKKLRSPQKTATR